MTAQCLHPPEPRFWTCSGQPHRRDPKTLRAWSYCQGALSLSSCPPVPSAVSLGPLSPSPCSAPRFETQDTAYGPFLTSVQGMAVRPKEQHYWQLLSGLGTSLQMGEWWGNREI